MFELVKNQSLKSNFDHNVKGRLRVSEMLKVNLRVFEKKSASCFY